MTIQTDITKAMNKLKSQAIKRGGVWENFGQKEVRALKDKYGDVGLINDFENWCMNMDDRQLQMEKKEFDIQKETGVWN
jgi:hypothetical protein